MSEKTANEYLNVETQADYFCKDLPSMPLKKAGTILVTGASGYIGGRLVPELVRRGYKVRVMVRSEPEHYRELWPEAEVVAADALNYDRLSKALQDVHAAYYLIHSLLLGRKKFHAADVRAAVNFRKAAEENGLKRIIYLSGLGDKINNLSDHLSSRLRVAQELKKGEVPVTTLRAAVIIGSGSASYEILHHTAMKAPFIYVLDCLNNRCQPIAISDVIKYLVGSLETQETTGNEFDIGGRDILTYRKMIDIFTDILGRHVRYIQLPLRNIGIYSYFVSLLTPVPAPLVKCLMEGLQNEVVCRDNCIRKLIPFEPLSYETAIRKALERELKGVVVTRWSDAYQKYHSSAVKLHQLRDEPGYRASYSISTKKSRSALFASICMIGGREGWFNNNWMWRLRGMVDKLLLGVGSSRGRKNHNRLMINDVVDFWRVEDIKRDKRLLLRAEMKLPGKAWLEFNIDKKDFDNILSVTAYYATYSLAGRIYWYIFLPFHHFIFKDLIREIEKRS